MSPRAQLRGHIIVLNCVLKMIYDERKRFTQKE